MPRFIKNRWWAFILALSLVLTCGAASVSPVAAELSYGEVGNGTDPGGTPGDGTLDTGDPDVPTGPGKQYSRSAQPQPPQLSERRYSGAPAVGDGEAPTSVLVLRLHVVLRSLRGVYLRF
jgi:hypothetical protein